MYLYKYSKEPKNKQILHIHEARNIQTAVVSLIQSPILDTHLDTGILAAQEVISKLLDDHHVAIGVQH